MKQGTLRVALRADAATDIGLGHVKRCLALARALRTVGADVRFLTRSLDVDAGRIVVAAGIEPILLPRPEACTAVVDHVTHAAWARVTWDRDADESAAALASWHPDWVIVDHYAFDSRWHMRVSQVLGARIGVIDDLADRDLSAGLLVDHNLSTSHREKYSGRIPASATLLGGPRFALLDSAYAERQPLSPRGAVQSIGIFMGGVDAADLSSVAVRACREHAGFTGTIEIVTTRANPRLQRLVELARQWPGTSVAVDRPNLADFFARHDLQVGAGGGAAWERCALGVPTLALMAAANQGAVLPALAQLGAIEMVASSGVPDEALIGRALRALIADEARRRQLGERARALVDGRGALRVALWLAASFVSVRPATLDDAQMMFDWRNHPSTRSMSLTQAPIAWASHREWLAVSLTSRQRALLVGQVGPIDIGVIRFDVRSAEEIEVSLYLDPTLHGLGLGRGLLSAGEDYMRAQAVNFRRFTATVLAKNAGSMRLFASCGYRSLDEAAHEESRQFVKEMN